jgi:hypothetical protein
MDIGAALVVYRYFVWPSMRMLQAIAAGCWDCGRMVGKPEVLRSLPFWP